MDALKAARENRLKEIQMEAILKECVVYFFFVMVLFFISYQTRDMASYNFNENIKNTFVRTKPAFDSVRNLINWIIRCFDFYRTKVKFYS